MQMLEHRPHNRQQFAQLSGVGERKLEQYADEFIGVINAHVDDDVAGHKSDTVEQTLKLFNNGMKIDDIAVQRSLTPSTVYSHLAKLIELQKLQLSEVTGLPDQQIKIIESALLNDAENGVKLKAVYESLDGQYEYGVIRCVQAAMLN